MLLQLLLVKIAPPRQNEKTSSVKVLFQMLSLFLKFEEGLTGNNSFVKVKSKKQTDKQTKSQ